MSRYTKPHSAQILRSPIARRHAADQDLERIPRKQSLLTAACICRGAGACSTCRAWDLRMRLADLIAKVT